MKALVTGIDGFVGSHLTSLLLGEGTQVFGLVHDMGRVHRLQAVADRVDLVPGDVTRSEDLVRVLDRVMPDEIYHLAGAAHVPPGRGLAGGQRPGARPLLPDGR